MPHHLWSAGLTEDRAAWVSRDLSGIVRAFIDRYDDGYRAAAAVLRAFGERLAEYDAGRAKGLAEVAAAAARLALAEHRGARLNFVLVSGSWTERVRRVASLGAYRVMRTVGDALEDVVEPPSADAVTRINWLPPALGEPHPFDAIELADASVEASAVRAATVELAPGEWLLVAPHVALAELSLPASPRAFGAIREAFAAVIDGRYPPRTPLTLLGFDL